MRLWRTWCTYSLGADNSPDEGSAKICLPVWTGEFILLIRFADVLDISHGPVELWLSVTGCEAVTVFLTTPSWTKQLQIEAISCPQKMDIGGTFMYLWTLAHIETRRTKSYKASF